MLNQTSPWTLNFTEIGARDLPRVGGKGANLGQMASAGFPVPPGFCVTTSAFESFVGGCPQAQALYADMDTLRGDDVEGARSLGERVRTALLGVEMPPDVAAAVCHAWRQLDGTHHAWAVRSSATAEDLPGASFAGQQDTYLNIRGEDAILDAVKRCWISLFTDRALLYRAKNGFGHRAVSLSVVIQRMIASQAAGIMFTADPVSGHRGVVSIDAGFGLGEALVSGLVNADLYKVDKANVRLLSAIVADKAIAIRPLPEGGTVRVDLPANERTSRVLDDSQIQALASLGARIEAHYGQPQDIEWCLEDGQLFIVQARPITSLFPLIPKYKKYQNDGLLHIFISFGHLQNMTDPMSPLGADLWRSFLPVGKSDLRAVVTDNPVIREVGGQLFMDATSLCRTPKLRDKALSILGFVHPGVRDGLQTLMPRLPLKTYAQTLGMVSTFLKVMGPVLIGLCAAFLRNPSDLRAWAEDLLDRSVDEFCSRLQHAPPGAQRLREAHTSCAALFLMVRPVLPIMVSGMGSLAVLRSMFKDTPHASDVEALLRGLAGNVTTMMDLEVGDLADLVRPFPSLADGLRAAVGHGPQALEALRVLPGGPPFLDALSRFIARYGCRAQAEIDISRARWSDDPSLVLSTVLGGLSHKEHASHRTYYTTLHETGEAAAQRLIQAAASSPGGWWRASLVRRFTNRVRQILGLREHPKFALIRCLAAVREAVLDGAAILVAHKLLARTQDVWFLRFPELIDLLEHIEHSDHSDHAKDHTIPDHPSALPDAAALVAQRRTEQEQMKHLRVPLIITSEGEIPTPKRPDNLPPNVIPGIAASPGVVEGIAKVVLDPSSQILHAGEILVAPYTDPGWTPLFVHARGLVCDVGGLMTHGAVVAREYGIPAVMSVGDGTTRIKTGQRLRVDGSLGTVEILPPSPEEIPK
jgi:phosphohistidine swiveling domain-containing protein